MSIEPTAPLFPTRESLTRFFRTEPRSEVPIAEVAQLLGVSRQTFRGMLESEGEHANVQSIGWSEAAAYLFDAWPRAEILDALDDADFDAVIPAEFHLTRVTWRMPIFIVRAMQHQAALAWQADPRIRTSLVPNHVFARRIDDYIADLLYAEIEPATLAAFSDDIPFVRAFHYPVID